MKKIFKISKFFPIFAIVFVVGGIVSPNIASAEWFEILNPATWVTSAAGALSIGILKLTTYLTYLSGIFLNYVARYAVVDMKTSLEGIGSIDVAWRTIRDIANMSFIFILLYAAIMTIIGKGSETRRTIVMVIVVAILINFSLFFTKLIIDASNVLAITFYDSIAPNALTDAGDTSLSNGFGVNVGISNSLMQSLRIQSLYDVSELTEVNYGVSDLLIVGVMGTIISLVAAFVFFAIAILLIIRFVILILVMILSPLAFVGLVLPQASKYTTQWKDALIGQAFFAPIYFLLTWIVIVVARGLTLGGNMAAAIGGVVGASGTTAPDPGAVGAIVNFVVVIVLLISSIVIAKEWANKAPGGVSKLTSWAMGAAGGATLGMAGRFGRNTFGRVGQAIGDSEKLKDMEVKGGARGFAARVALSTGRKTGGASFDARGVSALGALDAGKTQKGGFAQALKDKRKKEADFTKSLGPSDELITEAERRVERAPRDSDERAIAQMEVDRLKGVDDKEALRRIKRAHQGEEDFTEADAKAILEEDKARPTGLRLWATESLSNVRKEEQIRNVERSPTFKAAGVAERVFGQTKGLRWIPNVIKAKNRVAIAEMRKGKKPVKDTLEEILREAGDIPPAPEGGGANPTPQEGGPTPQA